MDYLNLMRSLNYAFFERLCFLMKDVCAWYREHYGGSELSASSTREVALIEFGALIEPYPLVKYMVGGLGMVMLKNFISLPIPLRCTPALLPKSLPKRRLACTQLRRPGKQHGA